MKPREPEDKISRETSKSQKRVDGEGFGEPIAGTPYTTISDRITPVEPQHKETSKQ
ncbi:MAG: hypothetical protein M0Z31_11230 [Clostridia bacterium]|nr:hypothetical protein [Clostridia bacterium]